MQTKLLINGKLVAGEGKVEDVLNPATGKVLARVPEASRAQIDAAVKAADAAFAVAVEEVVHFAEGGAGFEDVLVDHLLVGFDLLGHADLAFAVEEGDAAHFAEIHADGVVVKAFGFEFFGGGGFADGGSAFGEAFFGFVDDLDAILAEVEDDVVHLVQEKGAAGQNVVDLFKGDIAGVLAQVHQFLQAFVVSDHVCSFRGGLS